MLDERTKYLWAFIVYVFKRFSENRNSSVAAELTVTSLLALVPLTTVVFALLSIIPSFQDLGVQLQAWLFKYFVPGTGEIVQTYISEFVGKAKGLSGIGSLALMITALLMMRTVDTSFNNIWHIRSRQSLLRTLLVYWAVLTLGPILLGSSLLLTSYIQSLPIVTEVVGERELGITVWLPFVMSTFVFCLIFYVIPNRKIPFQHALFSALLTAALFEAAKYLFKIFVTSFSTYQVIFGALAAIPLFLIWIYLGWSIVLLGAEFCHALDAFELSRKKNRQHPFIEVLCLLRLLAEFQRAGQTPDEDELRRVSQQGKRASNIDWIEKLVAAGMVSKGQEKTYCLVKSATDIDYLNIYHLVGRQLPSLSLIEKAELPAETRQQLLAFTNQLELKLSDLPVSVNHQESEV